MMRDKDLRYQCFKCGEIEVFSKDDYRIDGRSCKKCRGHLIPMGYVVIGVDLATGPDQTSYRRPN